jgi:hypothetical protein
MRAGRLLAGLAAVMTLSRGLPAQDWSGYFKNFSIGFNMPPGLASDDLLWQSSNRLRLKYQKTFRKDVGLDAAWEGSPRFQDPALFNLDPFGFPIQSSTYRIVDPSSRPYPCADCAVGHFGFYQNLDRLAVTWKTSKTDIILGRQAIAWGSARVINPTNVIAPFAFNELDKEDVYGVDALRMRVPTGSLSEVDIGYVPGHHFDFHQGALFLRGRTNLRHTDVTVMVGSFRDNLLLGLDVARSLGQMGFSLEVACVDVRFLDRTVQGPNYARVSVGLDRSLSRRLYALVEYHFNSAGAGDPAEYSQLFGLPAYQTGNVYLLGRHYLSIGGNLQVTPLHELRLLAVGNLNDGSLSLSPSWEFNLTTNSYLAAGAIIGGGKGPSSLPGRPLRFNSEFGSYPDMLYASFRYFF